MQVNTGDPRKRLDGMCRIPHKRVDPMNGESPHTTPADRACPLCGGWGGWVEHVTYSNRYGVEPADRAKYETDEWPWTPCPEPHPVPD